MCPYEAGTMLLTMHIDMIASMPCNPSVGGPAKGIVVREIDALGGEMGKAADRTALQLKMLNTNKGPGVQSLRVQSDKLAYRKYMQDVCLHTDHLKVKECIVEKINFKDKRVTGVTLHDGSVIECKALILTSGTFMSSNILVGHTSTESGPEDEPTTKNLSQSLRDQGIRTFRLKTEHRLVFIRIRLIFQRLRYNREQKILSVSLMIQKKKMYFLMKNSGIVI